MKVAIQRLDPSLPLPMYKTKGSVAFDFVNREDETVVPGKVGFLKLNAIIRIPKGQLLILIPRSSLPLKRGLLIPNGIGLIDQDFCGPEDEIRLEVFNFTPNAVHVPRGDRVAQGFFMDFKKVEWEEVEKMEQQQSRGGWGSTGGYTQSS